MTPLRDDERGREALTQLDEAFAPHEDDTRHNMRAFRATLSEVRSMHVEAAVAREKDAARRRQLAWKLGGVFVPLLISGLLFSGRMLFVVGGVDEQQRAVRADVSRVLAVVERLDRDGETTRAKLDEGSRDRAGIHEDVRALEKRFWDQRRGAEEDRR